MADKPVLPALNITLPLVLGDMWYESTTNYGDLHPGDGIGHSYKRLEYARADIYEYDFGITGLTTGIESPMVTWEFSKAQNDIMKRFTDARWVSSDMFEVKYKEEALEFLHGVFLIESDGTTNVSEVFVTTFHGQFIKVRYTADMGGLHDGAFVEGTPARLLLNDLVKALFLSV